MHVSVIKQWIKNVFAYILLVFVRIELFVNL